jgi:hypothetical protein
MSQIILLPDDLARFYQVPSLVDAHAHYLYLASLIECGMRSWIDLFRSGLTWVRPNSEKYWRCEIYRPSIL